MKRQLWGWAIAIAVAAFATTCAAAEDDARWVSPLCEKLDVSNNGPFTELEDGSLMTIDHGKMKVSKDDGKTWSDPTPVCEGIAGPANRREPAAYYVVRTKNGVLSAVYLNFKTYHFSWDRTTNQPKDDCSLEIWAIRSLDGGKTWVDNQCVLKGYNPNFFGFIQTSKGRLVCVVPHIVLDPGRYAACSLTSDDDGKTWRHSNFIDLGGHGDHSGAMEPAIAELSDGRLLTLIRTHWGRFWEAYSEDDGLNWRTILPSQIKAPSAPGYLLKLKSGRLAFLYNPPPNRQELAVIFSEDDAKTWTKPLVIAKQKGGQISYPFLMERRPGELWMIAGFAFKQGWKDPVPLRLKADEKALFEAAKKVK